MGDENSGNSSSNGAPGVIRKDTHKQIEENPGNNSNGSCAHSMKVKEHSYGHLESWFGLGRR